MLPAYKHVNDGAKSQVNIMAMTEQEREQVREKDREKEREREKRKTNTKFVTMAQNDHLQ